MLIYVILTLPKREMRFPDEMFIKSSLNDNDSSYGNEYPPKNIPLNGILFVSLGASYRLPTHPISARTLPYIKVNFWLPYIGSLYMIKMENARKTPYLRARLSVGQPFHSCFPVDTATWPFDFAEFDWSIDSSIHLFRAFTSATDDLFLVFVGVDVNWHTQSCFPINN